MPNSFGSTGLVTATSSELVANATTSLQTIYGAGINIGPETPDGQMLMIPIQVALDQQQLIAQVNASFDPDQATGNVLAQRGAINGIAKQAGTYTTVNVQLVTSQSVNLYGLDQTAQAVYTVADASSNNYQLGSTQLGLAAGTHTLLFVAAKPGALSPAPNTITIPVSIVLGVSSVNNPSAALSVGVNEESDGAFRVRRAQSVALSSQGFYDGLKAALLNVAGVTYVNVEENSSGTTNSDGVPGHSVWVVVAGSGTPAAIAQAIYTKRNGGCGMYGSSTYSVTRADGSLFPIYWDNVVAQPCFATFTLTSLDGSTPPNAPAILGSLSALLVPGVAAQVNANELATLVQDIDPNSLVTGVGFSNGLTQYVVLSGLPASGSFQLTYGGSATAFIPWNASTATIQTDVQALPGLGSATVAGSLTSGSLTVSLTGVSSPTLIGVANNNLQTSGSAAIALNFLSTGYSATLSPSAKNKQLVTSSPNFICLPVYVTTSKGSVSVSSGSLVSSLALTRPGSASLALVGGYGSATWKFAANATSATVNASTGLYVAGASAGTDVVTGTDALGNVGSITIVVS